MSSQETAPQKFRVFVRLRPVSTNQALPSQETENESQGERPLTSARGENGVCNVEHRIITLNDPAKGHSSEFVFDRVFGADTSQEAVFSEVAKPLIQHVVQGNNGCCFAYGQTGSGKTYSMFGKEHSVDPSTRGIIPLSVFELFKVVEAAKASGGTLGRVSIFVSLLEIYLEQVRDLGRGVQASLESGLPRRHSSSSGTGSFSGINSSSRRHSSTAGVLPKGARQAPSHSGEDWTTTSLDVMEDPSGTTIIKDMTYIEVSDPSEVMAIVNEAGRLRATAATLQNDVSSRSHTVFTLSVVQHRDARKPFTGRLHLVDLAGSERLGKSGSSNDSTRLAETKAINKSLSSLGKVVMSLTQGHGDKKGDGDKPTHHVPYRDSKLTRILKNSLQGNCMTHMLTALNPASVHIEECFNTLQFAVRCQNLSLAPRVTDADGGPAGGGHRMGSDGGEGGEAAEQLAQQVAALQEELDFTHSHYQKMIEGIAGPNWTSSLLLERSAAGAVEQQASLLGGTRDGDQAAPLGGGASFAMEGGMKGQSQEFRRLQTALETARTKQKDTEAALLRKRADADDLRDRLAAKDQMQLAEIRKLRAQVADLTTHADEVQLEERSKADKARQLLAEEVNRLTHDNKVIRIQLERVTMSVNEVIDKHTAHVSREEANREAMRIGIERALGQQIEATEKERVRQVDNLKQQSAHFLEQKSQEIFSLKSQMTQLRTEHELEAKQLRAEVDLLTTYAERVTELLQKMEAGAHGTVEMSGIRSLKVPHKDRPAGIDLEHLQQLRHCGDAVQRMLEMARAAAAKPGSRPASAHPSSRPVSALVPSPAHTHAAGPAAAMKSGGTLPRSGPSSAAAHPSSTRTQVPPYGAHPQTSSALPVPALGSLPLPPGCTSLSSLPVHQQWLQNQQQRQDRGSEAEHRGDPPREQEQHKAVDGAKANAEEDPHEKSLQYIRSLEEALAKQRAQTFAERRRQGELTVALRSALRSARFPNPMQAALLNAPMGHSPHWGYGHNQLSNSLLSSGLNNGLQSGLYNGLAEASSLGQAPSSWAAAPVNGSARSVNRPASAGPSQSLGMSQVGAEGLGLMGRGSMSGSGGWRSRSLTASAAGARAAVQVE